MRYLFVLASVGLASLLAQTPEDIAASLVRQGDALMRGAEKLGHKAEKKEAALEGDETAVKPKKLGKPDKLASDVDEHREQQQQKWKEAEALYRQASGIVPSRAEYHVRLAEVLVLLRRFDRKNAPGAETEYRAAIGLDPENPKLFFDLAAVYWSSKRWSDAEKSAAQAARLDPSSAVYSSALERIRKHQPPPKH